MVATILGLEKVDYISKKTEKPVNGYRFFLGEETKGVYGQRTFDCFLNEEHCRGVVDEFTNLESAVGAEVEYYYNRYGRIETLSLVG